jgi:NADH-quinone oxidoreductase E subunit
MSVPFELTPDNQQRFEEILKKYPKRRAAMLPTLHLAQEQAGFITPEVEECVAKLLEVPVIDVREVVTFYSLFSQKPMGKHHFRVCTSLSCWVRGCDDVKEYLREKLELEEGQVSADGEYSWDAVPDCLGACELAPMLQLDGYFEGNLTRDKIDALIKDKLAQRSGKD